MRKSHRISFTEYEEKPSKQLEVERKRDMEYKKSKNIIADVENQLYK
ncbi:hypothetical protein [Oceanobacillus sp. CAU 1775]